MKISLYRARKKIVKKIRKRFHITSWSAYPYTSFSFYYYSTILYQFGLPRLAHRFTTHPKSHLYYTLFSIYAYTSIFFTKKDIFSLLFSFALYVHISWWSQREGLVNNLCNMYIFLFFSNNNMKNIYTVYIREKEKWHINSGERAYMLFSTF